MGRKRRLQKSQSRDSRSPTSGDDLASARDKFKGALLDLFPHSEDESASTEEEDQLGNKKRSYPKKKTQEKAADVSGKLKRIFVMKLFDRSVDLAQFNEKTPLYPICRAWFTNQPHSVYNIELKVPKPEIKEEPDKDEESGHSADKEVKDLFAMPAPEPPPEEGVNSLKIPKPLAYTPRNISPVPEGGEPPSKDALLQDNLNHWIAVRKEWLKCAAKNESRYKKSEELLSNMFNRLDSFA